jgi:SAM-dependent methyltransferase
MKIGDRVRQAYERRPYPFGNLKALTGRSWNLDLGWVEAIGRPGSSDVIPARILVAGCGDGTEAFNLRRLLPKSEIVAVDFSARSIAIARRLQSRNPEVRDILFIEADLADRRLPAIVGSFDLITCQGVLSYIARPESALRNLGRCLKPDGVLYIGVNGADHVSTRLRPSLAKFGYNVDQYKNGRRLRGVLKLCDTVHAADGHAQVAVHGPSYLASDVFGPLNQSLTLADWISRARGGGLHFRGNRTSTRLIRRIADNGSYPALIPWSRSKVCEILEELRPSAFHQLLFSRKPESNPAWGRKGPLLRRRIELTRLFNVRLPKPAKTSPGRPRRLRITDEARNIVMELMIPEWEAELLRGSDGRHSLESLILKSRLEVPFDELRKQLFLLYQLGVINLLPAR